ncbi:MAG: thiamine pyrophosphate-binding protein [Chloroflexi bacterium]|nr:thiamine pyrophosphate-binding protein [Chloroflexota bacterium]
MNAIVVTTESARLEWPRISSEPDLDIAAPRSMGKASSFGLGLALALPDRKVVILDGDGSLLMNLGTLVTIANIAPSNLVHFVFENGVYRTTGGQVIPGAGKLSFKGLAEQAGYRRTYEFDDLRKFRDSIKGIMDEKGPTFVCLKAPRQNAKAPFPLPAIVDAAALADRLQKALSSRASARV